jgi:hypothetical protein
MMTHRVAYARVLRECLLPAFGRLLADVDAGKLDVVVAARRKGKWTGGSVPIRYRAVDRKLVKHAPEAMVVREMFDLYENRRSVLDVVRGLRARGRTRRKGGVVQGCSAACALQPSSIVDGNTLLDLSGSGNNAQLVGFGPAPAVDAGPFGPALDCADSVDSGGAYVDLPS